MTVPSLVINLIAAVSSGKVPRIAVQRLWMNLIMDILVALALATNDLMLEPPVSRSKPLITIIMCRNIMAEAMY